MVDTNTRKTRVIGCETNLFLEQVPASLSSVSIVYRSLSDVDEFDLNRRHVDLHSSTASHFVVETSVIYPIRLYSRVLEDSSAFSCYSCLQTCIRLFQFECHNNNNNNNYRQKL